MEEVENCPQCPGVSWSFLFGLCILTLFVRRHRPANLYLNSVFFRFGKTISVSMFAAAMIYSTPGLELSIYSTCKRISQKLLRNVQKFLDLIYLELGGPRMKEIRVNMEEIVLRGEEDEQDVRVVNSYPSKVRSPHTNLSCLSLRVVVLQSLDSFEHR